jgi:hypothetical protein
MSRRNQHLKLQRFLHSPQICGEKRRYASKAEAEIVLQEQELLNPGLHLRTYQCIVPGCHGWHLTRKTDVV